LKEAAGWLLQRVTGAFLLAGVLFHFFFMHFTGPEKITYEVVIQRLSSPWWRTFDIIFLSTAIFHGFNGLWGLVLEYIRGDKLRGVTQVLILVSAAVLFVTGIYIVML
jgi:succinate dehydrogenase / fumarate reductase membrane anchor subunit